jgi:hypothetical protein
VILAMRNILLLVVVMGVLKALNFQHQLFCESLKNPAEALASSKDILVILSNFCLAN